MDETVPLRFTSAAVVSSADSDRRPDAASKTSEASYAVIPRASLLLPGQPPAGPFQLAMGLQLSLSQVMLRPMTVTCTGSPTANCLES